MCRSRGRKYKNLPYKNPQHSLVIFYLRTYGRLIQTFKLISGPELLIHETCVIIYILEL